MKNKSSRSPRGRDQAGRDRPRAQQRARRGEKEKQKRAADEGARAPLGVGAKAPAFELNSTPDQKVSLKDFRGQPVVLFFYPADWSPVCGDQLALYNEILPEFHKLGAQIVGISVDGAWCHDAFARDRKLHFPLLADFEPKGQVARQYGVYRHAEGVCERAFFVLDGEGIITWSYVSPVGVNPGADGILKALEDLQDRRHQEKKEPQYV